MILVYFEISMQCLYLTLTFCFCIIFLYSHIQFVWGTVKHSKWTVLKIILIFYSFNLRLNCPTWCLFFEISHLICGFQATKYIIRILKFYYNLYCRLLVHTKWLLFWFPSLPICTNHNNFYIFKFFMRYTFRIIYLIEK